MGYTLERSFAQQMDANDSLRCFRDRFRIPSRNGIDQVYFLGNSLGLQPQQTATEINQVLDQWAAWGVEGFFNGPHAWMDFHDSLTAPLANIVGALAHEVVIMNHLTVNLHLMLTSFYQPSGTRTKILVEAGAFPSDQYMLESHLKYLGLNPDEIILTVTPNAATSTISTDQILAAVDQAGDQLALVFLGGVHYYSGQFFDLKKITHAAHAVGATVGFDLAHAAGNVPLQLHTWDVDFACWCNYKYLNAGPGAIGAAYIHERYHQNTTIHRLAGWWGYRTETRFKMQPGFDPIPSAAGWQLSTPPMLLLASLKASLQLFEEAGMDRLHEKRQALSDYAFYLLSNIAQDKEAPHFQIITPANPEQRGAQLSLLMLQQGKQIFEMLTEQGFWVDWREPNVIRLAAVPLYNTFEEIWRFAEALQIAMRREIPSL